MKKAKGNKLIKIIALASVFAVVFLMPACKKSSVLDCFNSTGKIEKTERQVSYFHSILLKDNINLHLVPSNQNKLVLEAGSNLMPKIITEVNEDSVLVIKNDNSCNWVRSYDKPINIYLELTELRNIEYRSIGNITNSDTLRMDSLNIDIWEGAGKIQLVLKTHQCKASLHYGTADIVLSGESDLSFYFQLGAGKIDARDLESPYVYLRNWSSNNMYVRSHTYMSAEIKGLGNVYYYGNPDIESYLPGEGKLIKLSK